MDPESTVEFLRQEHPHQALPKVLFAQCLLLMFVVLLLRRPTSIIHMNKDVYRSLCWCSTSAFVFSSDVSVPFDAGGTQGGHTDGGRAGLAAPIPLQDGCSRLSPQPLFRRL
eukprot:5296744-Pyramimonas_sp.AAC.3